MKRPWLATSSGSNFVAAGIVVTLVLGPLIVVQDIVFLISGVWLRFSLGRHALYLSMAAVAVVFAIANIFVFRPGLPKYVAGVVAISFASYLFQPFLHAQPHQLIPLAIARSLVICRFLVFVWLEVWRASKAGKTKNSSR